MAPRPEPKPREAVDLLLVGGTVVTMDADWRILPEGAVAVRDGAIVAVGPGEDLRARFAAAEVRDCAGCAVLPGLVNGHTHLPMSLFRGFVADQQLDVWLFGYVFPVERRFVTPEFVYAGALLSCAELIRGGVTTFVDMYYFEEEVARAADEAGLRAICAQGVMRLPTPDAASWDEGLARAERYMAAWQGHPRVTPTVAPHAPYTCTEEIYRRAAALAARYGAPLVTHLAETARELAESRAERGTTPVAWVAATGAFNGPCVAAHCVHLAEEDFGTLAAHGVGAVPCPSSNLKLASGIAPYARLLAAGVRLGLGTDGPASNDDQDLWTELHLAALLPKGTGGDPTALPAREALALATRRGAEAVHLGHLVGSLEAGKRADVVVLALDGLHTGPRYRYDPEAIYSTLVYAARAADVRDVLVDGRWLLRDQALLTLDAPAVRARAQELADAVDAFLAEREADLLDKLLAIADVTPTELFEVQVKARLTDEAAADLALALAGGGLAVADEGRRSQRDTVFLWADPAKGRLRLREERRPGAAAPAVTLLLSDPPAARDEYPGAVLLGRARYLAPANHSERFYREYFQPDRVLHLHKERREWRVTFAGETLDLRLDRLVGAEEPGPYLELKCRTWSRADAERKAALLGALLARLGVAPAAWLKAEYADLAAAAAPSP